MKTKANFRRVTLDIPDYILEEIDIICVENFISRKKWFIDAANDKLGKEKLEKIDKLVRK